MAPAVILAGICLVYPTPPLASGRDQENGFFIQDAELADPQYLAHLDRRSSDDRVDDRKNFGVFAHRVEAGSGVVIGLRSFYSGTEGSEDGEGFEKITIWLPALPQFGTTIDRNHASKYLAVITRGGSAWPQNACSGYLSLDTLTVQRVGRSASVSINGEIHPAGNRGVWDNCHSGSLHTTFGANEISISDVTPWLGKPGEHVYAETYP